jgi:hypothetical protein
MKFKKFKLTPQVHKDIIAIAQQLPPLQKLSKLGNPLSRAVSRPVKGSDLPEGTLVKGKPVQPDGRYIQKGTEPILINHKLNLIETFENEGPEGMRKYVASVKKIFKDTEEKLAAEELAKKSSITPNHELQENQNS